MRITKLRRLVGREPVALLRFIQGELVRFANDVVVGLGNLSFADNFAGGRVDVSDPVASAALKVIPNRLHTPAVDILFLNQSQPFVVTAINSENITIKNTGSAAGVVTVLILKR